MRIINSPPFTTSSLQWQEQPGQWTLTLVCKVTFSLVPGTAVIAAEQEAINEHDNHWDDDPQKSVYAPSDLVPYKPSPEVLLVGSAFAPRGEPVRSLFARMIVGQLDNSVEVFGQRTISPDGALVEGPRWTQMSLRYERAGGGEGSWNPVGIDSSVTDPYGRRSIPNLQPPAFQDVDRGAQIPAIGYGPLAPRWPVRHDKLEQLGPAFAEGNWTETPLGMDFDGSYFQSAPWDQLIEEIRADETIVLENLHPDVERLVTRLPGLMPRTRVEIDGFPPWELTLVADTLWIDTNRAICTVTFRGQFPLEGRDQPGTIYIGVEYPGEPVQFPDASGRAHAPSAPESPPEDDFDDADDTHTDGSALEKDRSTVLPFKPSASPALPWDPGTAPRVPPVPVPARPASPARPKSPADLVTTGAYPAVAAAGAMPKWLGKGAPDASKTQAPEVPPAAAQIRVTAGQTMRMSPVAPPPVAQILRTNEVAPPASAAAASQQAAAPDHLSSGLIQRPVPPVAPPMSRPVPPIAPPMPMPPAQRVPAPPPPVRSFAPTLPGAVAPPPAAPPMPQAAPVGTTFGQAAVLAAAKAQAAVPPAKPSNPIAASSPVIEKDRSRPGKPDPRTLATAAFLGAAEASNAAATTVVEEKEDKLPKEKTSASASGPSPGRTLIDFLWHDPEVASRLEKNPAWKRILEVAAPEEKKAESEDEYIEPDPDKPQKKPPEPPPEKTPEQKARDAKSRVAKIISQASPTSDVENALYSAINDDGVLEPPLCLVTGELELPFDEAETLKVLTSAAAPLATADKKLKETIDLANEVLGTPLGKSPEVAANFSLRVREAWLKANRMLPPDYLEVHSRRVLLEERKYQMRELASAQWIRAVVHGVSGDKPIPTYLPADLSKKLPLFIKFSVRMIVEVLLQQDQNEAHPIALRVYALARTAPARPRR